MRILIRCGKLKKNREEQGKGSENIVHESAFFGRRFAYKAKESLEMAHSTTDDVFVVRIKVNLIKLSSHFD